MFFFFFFNDTATTEIYTLSLHDALPICRRHPAPLAPVPDEQGRQGATRPADPHVRPAREVRGGSPRLPPAGARRRGRPRLDRKSTRLNSSHSQNSYAVFCLEKKKN